MPTTTTEKFINLTCGFCGDTFLLHTSANNPIQPTEHILCPGCTKVVEGNEEIFMSPTEDTGQQDLDLDDEDDSDEGNEGDEGDETDETDEGDETDGEDDETDNEDEEDFGDDGEDDANL